MATIRYYKDSENGLSLSGSFGTSATISAQNTFTDAVEFDTKIPFDLSITNASASTVTLQRSFDNGSTWVDVFSTDESVEKGVQNFTRKQLWRAGVKTGDYVGTVTIILSQADRNS